MATTGENPQSGIMVSSNPNAYPIVKMSQVAGFKTVKDVKDLYTLKSCILYENNDTALANGQIWYVQDSSRYYRLKNVTNVTLASGWEEVKFITDSNNLNILNFKGVEDSETDIFNLPTSDLKTGDVYYARENGAEYVYIDDRLTNKWEKLGETTNSIPDANIKKLFPQSLN